MILLLTGANITQLQEYFVKWLFEEAVCMFCKSISEYFYEMCCNSYV